MTANRMRARAGMTLMELVVGLVITGMMAVAGTAAFTSIIDHRRTVRDASVADERASALRSMVRSWIVAGNVQIQQGGGPRLGRAAASAMSQASTSAAKAAGDEVTFTTNAPNPAMLPNVRMRLFVDADAGTPEHGLTIEWQPNTASPLQRRMLDSTIDSLVVEFLDSRTNRWYESTQAAPINPRAVRVTMLATQQNPYQIPRLLTVPMTLVVGTTGGNAQGRAVP